MSTLKKLGVFYLLTCVLDSYLVLQCFEQLNSYVSKLVGFLWLVNDVRAILFVLLFFQLVDQMQLKVSYKYSIFGILIVIAPCISYRFLVSSGVTLATIQICLLPLSVIGVEYLIGLANLIHVKSSDEARMRRGEVLASMASMRFLFSTIILFFVFKEGIPEWAIVPLLLIILGVKFLYIGRVFLLGRKL